MMRSVWMIIIAIAISSCGGTEEVQNSTEAETTTVQEIEVKEQPSEEQNEIEIPQSEVQITDINGGEEDTTQTVAEALKNSQAKRPKVDPTINKDVPVDTKLQTGWYLITDTPTPIERLLGTTKKHFPIQPNSILTRKDFSKVNMFETQAGSEMARGISMILTPDAKKRFAEVTANNVGNGLAFVLNDKLLYVAVIYAEVNIGVVTMNLIDFSKEETFKLQEDIRASE